MKPFVLSQMSPEQIETLAELDRRMQKIPDDFKPPAPFELVSCHMLTYALAAFTYPLELTVQDGWFGRGFNHSWFTDPAGHVFDTYPVGIMSGSGFSVQFVDRHVVRIGELYENVSQCKERIARKRDEERENGVVSGMWNPGWIRNPNKRTPQFRKAVRLLREVMA